MSTTIPPGVCRSSRRCWGRRGPGPPPVGRRRSSSARYFLAIGGLVYLALWIYGLAVDHGTDANFVPLNDADNWLHLGLGVGMLLLALLVWDRRGDVQRREVT